MIESKPSLSVHIGAKWRDPILSGEATHVVCVWSEGPSGASGEIVYAGSEEDCSDRQDFECAQVRIVLAGFEHHCSVLGAAEWRELLEADR